jgi:hypothetical protein
MSTLNVNALDKESGSTLTLGGAGTTVAVHASATTSGFDSGLASVQTFTSSGTWTKPSGITKVIIEVLGAGGSGSYAVSPNTAGFNGGGAGGYAKKLLDVSSVSSATITVGTGGAGNLGAGNSGGNSSWSDGTNTITGNGGSGANTTAYVRTSGGSATGGDLNITGEYGDCYGFANNSFRGGSTIYGKGGFGKYAGHGEQNTPPTGYGAGGGGSYNLTTVHDAADGIVIVTEYK